MNLKTHNLVDSHFLLLKIVNLIIMTVSAVIEKDCSSSELIATFFNELKEYVSISKVRSAVPVNGSVEVCFVDQESLVSFLAVAPEAWNIKSELKQEKLITIIPQVGEGHSQVSDQAMSAAMATYGKVIKGRRLFFREFPSIENGMRQFIIEPKRHVTIPSSIRFGKAGFRISYYSQTKTCHKCHSTEHIARECPFDYCVLCNQSGHDKSECDKRKYCTICKQKGHSYDFCHLLEEVNNVTLKKSWSKVVSGRPTSTPSLAMNSGIRPAGATGMTVLHKDMNYFDSPSNPGVAGAAGGAPVRKPSEIPPAPWHPKAKDPGHSNSQSINNSSDDSSDSDSDSDTTQNISLAQQSKRRSSVVSDGGEVEDGKRNKPDE